MLGELVLFEDSKSSKNASPIGFGFGCTVAYSPSRNIFDTFYINLDYNVKAKSILNGDSYDNSYFVVRFGYQF